MKRLLVGLLAAAVVAGCSSAQPVPPAESMPPTPVAPDGWAMLAAIGGTGGQGEVAVSVQLGGRATALHAACAGLGSLVVQLGDEPVAPAVVFPCGGHGGIADNRYELANITIPAQMTISAAVIEGPGDLYHSAFYVSVEQPAP
jgi:Prokaryotic membrane lipoprotein lipid attachment site